MKPWIKAGLGISVAWTLVMPFLMIHLILAPRAHSSVAINYWALKLMILNLASFIVITPAWGTFLAYAACRREWSVGKRVAWVIGLVGGPWVLITWPWFFIRYIVRHPANMPVFGARTPS